MESQDKNVQTLHKLGLTTLQAKIYLILIQIGKEKIQTISRIANIDRSNTYHTIIELQRIGLVEKMLGTPNFYNAIPVEDAVSSLLKRKQDQYSHIQREAQGLISVINAKDTKPENVEYKFKIVSKQKNTEQKDIAFNCEHVGESYDLLINKKILFTGVFDLDKYQMRAVKRGIKYRLVTEKMDAETLREKLKLFLAEPNFQIRYILGSLKTELIIRDKKTASIPLLPNSGMGEGPCLITDHPGCVEMFQDHFNKIWNEAKEYEFKKQLGNNEKNREHVAGRQKQKTSACPQAEKFVHVTI